MTQVANSTREATQKWAPSAPVRPVVAAVPTRAEWAVDEFGLPDYDFAPDAVLFDRLARRTDIVALGALYTRHAARLYGFLQRIGLADDEAQATLCELFVDLWRHHTADGAMSSFSPDGSVDAIAVRTASRHGPDANNGATSADPRVHRALQASNGQRHPDPPSAVREALMTRLGHPAVDHEASRTHRAARPVVFLFAFAAMTLATVAVWLSLV